MVRRRHRGGDPHDRRHRLARGRRAGAAGDREHHHVPFAGSVALEGPDGEEVRSGRRQLRPRPGARRGRFALVLLGQGVRGGQPGAARPHPCRYGGGVLLRRQLAVLPRCGGLHDGRRAGGERTLRRDRRVHPDGPFVPQQAGQVLRDVPPQEGGRAARPEPHRRHDRVRGGVPVLRLPGHRQRRVPGVVQLGRGLLRRQAPGVP